MANPLPTTGRENLYRADGSRRPDAEVLKEGGHLGLRLALLDDAMHGRAASADYDVQYPSRLFLSYKWGSEAENAWVRQLAHRLTQHRWDVVFDQWRDEAADRSVEEFVSRLVSCRVFVAVLSPAFIDSAIEAKHASWAFDEMQCALMARSRMRLVGIIPPTKLVDGTVKLLPPVVRMPPRPGELSIIVQPMRAAQFDEVYRVIDIDGLERFLDQSLTYDGPKLDDAARGWIAERLAAASSEASLRDILDRYPFVSGVWRRLVVLLRDRGDLQSALQAIQQALDHVHMSAERLIFEQEEIELLKRRGDRVGTARAATRLIDRRPHDWVAHFHLGDLLDDASELWAARSHLLLACRDMEAEAAPHNTLGVVYMGLGLLARADDELERALRKDPAMTIARRNLEKVRAERATSQQPDVMEVKGPLPGCSDCEAIFVPRLERPLTCAACGASRQGSLVPCDVCGAEGLLPTRLFEASKIAVRCPICRTGTIISKDSAKL
jgi:tetratricopeptide (TPR) repeat protein